MERGGGGEERDYFFVLSVGEVAGFVCRTGSGTGDKGWGSPRGNWRCWQSGREVEELGVSREAEALRGIGKDSWGLRG